MLNDLYNRFHHLLEDLDQNWIDGQAFSDAIDDAGSPLPNCLGFIDGTLRPCCRPHTKSKNFIFWTQANTWNKISGAVSMTVAVSFFYCNWSFD